MRAIQGSGGNRVDPSLQNKGEIPYIGFSTSTTLVLLKTAILLSNQVSLQEGRQIVFFTALDLMNEPQEEHYGVTQPREVLYRTKGRSTLDQF